MPVTTMFHSDSTDKDRTPYKSHPDQHGHWDVQDIAALLHERDALQAQYAVLKAAADGMAEILSDARQHMLDSAIGDGEKNLLIVALDFAVQDYRAATGKGQL